MLVREFSTERIAARERFAAWQAFMAETRIRYVISSDQEHDFRASARVLDLGDIRVAGLRCPNMRAMRTARLIPARDPEAYHLSCLVQAEGGVFQDGRGTLVRAGEMVLLDASRPFHGWLSGSPDTLSAIVLQVPQTLLPVPERAARRMLAVPVSGCRGMGAVLSEWLTDVLDRADEFTPEDAPALVTGTVSLLASLLTRPADPEPASPEARREALRARILDYVQQHLGDPALTPESVADAHGVSVRQLYRVFNDHDLTLAAWIRERRLEHCRRDLSDPRLRHRPAHAIAARWGLTDPAHFSRAFRTAYGVSPREYRQGTAALL